MLKLVVFSCTWSFYVLSLHAAETLHYGTYFILQFPPITDGQYIFFALTMSREPFNVTFRTAHNVDGDAEKQITLQSPEVKTVTFDGIRMPPEVPSATYAYVARSSGDYKFCLHVHYTRLNRRILYSIMLAIPVAGFGTRYYVTLAKTNPAIVVVAAQATRVNGILNLRDRMMETTTQQELSFTLQAEQAYMALIMCGYYDLAESTRGGVLFTAEKPIGIISGTCLVSALHLDKVSLDVILPVECIGRDYLIISPSKKEVFVSFSAVERNTVAVLKYSSQVLNFDLQEIGEFIVHRIEEYAVVAILNANKPVLCSVVFWNLIFFETENYFFEVSTTVPIGLFVNHYSWSTYAYNNIRKHWVVLMVQEKDKSNLIFDETTISNSSWRAVADTTSWRFVYLNITPGLHEAYTTEGAPFGCYIYGTGDRIDNVFKEAYAANVGFIVATIYGNVSGVLPEMTAGDMFDNDRDQRVDEEAPNGIDDDGDGLIDEDLAFPKTNHGNWGPWGEWLCPGVCGMARRHKVRTCSNPPASGYGLPCKGVSTFTGGNDSCHTGHTCPEDCGTGTYLVDCVGDCSNCENDCNKFNGSCDRCRLGWMDPLHACNTECPEMTFGFHCTGSCSDKCSNHDCLDRIQGTCPVVGQTRDFMLLLPILLFCPICFLPCIFRRKVQMLPESEVQDLTLPF